MSITDYHKYRGKCKEMAEAACSQNPDLTLVRGFYHDPFYGKEQHWWTKDKNGNIVDPTAKQFPIGGIKEFYEEFDGNCECSNCGETFKEEDGTFESNYAFCSGSCFARFVGL